MFLIIELISLTVLFVLSAFFSSSESALFSLDPMQIHRIGERHPRIGRRIEHALAHPTRLLSAILVGNTLVNVAASALGYAILDQVVSEKAVLVAIPSMTFLLLVFGEISPKRLALRYPEKLSELYAAPLDIFTRLMVPFTLALARVSRLLSSALTPSPRLTEEEYRTALIDSETRGILDAEERTIVEGIIRLEDLTAADVMTPRVDLVAVREDTDIPEVLMLARTASFKFLPVYAETLDEIHGFLDVRRFLLDRPAHLSEAIVSPRFVPSSIALDSLVHMFHSEKRRVACVVDEYGGTAGIVTKGDVMEEIIREAQPEVVQGGTGIKPLNENTYLVGGDTSLEDLNAELNLELEAEGVTRISGLVSSLLQRIPQRNDSVDLPTCRIVVRSINNLRITSLILEKKELAGEDEE